MTSPAQKNAVSIPPKESGNDRERLSRWQTTRSRRSLTANLSVGVDGNETGDGLIRPTVIAGFAKLVELVKARVLGGANLVAKVLADGSARALSALTATAPAAS